MDIQKINIDKVAAAIEADASVALPGLRESLAEAKAGIYGAVHTPAQIEARKPGRPLGTVKADTKEATTLRLDREVLEALRATGRGWQTRVNDLLLADIRAGRLAAVAQPLQTKN